MGTDMVNVTAPIYDHNNNLILPDEKNDDIFLGIEQTSGVNAQAKQRVQFNFIVYKDNLFNYTQNDYIVPLAFVQREAIITKDQIR